MTPPSVESVLSIVGSNRAKARRAAQREARRLDAQRRDAEGSGAGAGHRGDRSGAYAGCSHGPFHAESAWREQRAASSSARTRSSQLGPTY